jgi:hypothetical protein
MPELVLGKLSRTEERIKDIFDEFWCGLTNFVGKLDYNLLDILLAILYNLSLLADSLLFLLETSLFLLLYVPP